jgi:serine/threonine protein kinase
MAPEILFFSQEDRLKNPTSPFAADIWAIGCLSFLMCTKKPPFRNLSQQSDYAKGKVESPTFINEMDAFSEPGRKIVTQMLHWDPKQRPNAADALKAEWIAEPARRSIDSGRSRCVTFYHFAFAYSKVWIINLSLLLFPSHRTSTTYSTKAFQQKPKDSEAGTPQARLETELRSRSFPGLSR